MGIRFCTNEDVKEIFYLVCELKGKDLGFNSFKKIYKEKLKEEKNIYFLYDHEKDKKIVSFLGMNIENKLHHTKKVATIEELIVTKDYESNGIGRKMLEVAINLAKKKNCEEVELTSRFKRKRGHVLYAKSGFIKEGIKFVLTV